MSHQYEILQKASEVIDSISSSTPLGSFWPFPMLMTLHALKITVDYHRTMSTHGHIVRLHSNASPTQSPVTWLHGVSAVSLLVFSGSTVVAMLTATPAPWLLSDRVVGSYWMTFLMLTYMPPCRWALDTLLELSDTPALVFDLFLLFVDSVSRTSAITTGAIDLILRSPMAHQTLRSSWVAIITIGTLSGAMGGTLVSTLNLLSPDWSFRTPAVFGRGNLIPHNAEVPSHILPGKISWDVKSPFIIALAYSILIDAHPFFKIPYVHLKLDHGFLPPAQAKVVCTLAMFAIVAARRMGYLKEGIPPSALETQATEKSKKDD